MYNGEYIASNTNTILVTFNYRLGALGFLAYDDGNGETIEGNFGFKVYKCPLTPGYAKS